MIVSLSAQEEVNNMGSQCPECRRMTLIKYEKRRGDRVIIMVKCANPDCVYEDELDSYVDEREDGNDDDGDDDEDYDEEDEDDDGLPDLPELP
jgi:hypothetical protein